MRHIIEREREREWCFFMGVELILVNITEETYDFLLFHLLFYLINRFI
jgi:hypothetical protein